MRNTVVPLERLDHPDAVKDWARSRFDQALLVLADLTPPLRSFARYWVAIDAESRLLRGVAVRFEGFGQPVGSIATEDEDGFGALCAEVQGYAPTLVFVSQRQSMPFSFRSGAQSTDAWLVSRCVLTKGQIDPEVEPLKDPTELNEFVQRMGMHFWNPAMLRFGHAFGIRSSKGDLVCVGCLNFLLPEEKYAQIGPMVTDPAQRGRSMGTRVLDKIRSSLAIRGVEQCGLFASETDEDVIEFYRRRGFAQRGQFHLFNLRGG